MSGTRTLPPAIPRQATGLALALSVARQVALLGLPLLTMHVFDGVVEGRNLDTLAVLSLAFAVALALAAALRVLRGALVSAVADAVLHRVAPATLHAALRGAVAGGSAPGLAALRDLATLRRFLSGETPADLLDLAAVPVALTVLALLHPVHALVVGLGCIVLALLGLALDRTTRGTVQDAETRRQHHAATLQDRLRQADLLRGLGMLDAVTRRWQAAQPTLLEDSDRGETRARALRGVMALTGHLTQGAVVVAGVLLALADRASPGSVIAAMLLAGMATQPVARLAAAWQDWALAALAWRRLDELHSDDAAPAPRPADRAAPPGLVLRDLRWTPPGGAAPVLGGITLHVPPGTLTLVVGANGAGKSSLLRLALELAMPDAGRVLLDGEPAGHATVGYLPQDVQLTEGSVARAIARCGPEDMDQVVDAARLAGAHELIGRLPQGYATPVEILSAGQRRLVGLARALHGGPALLALDEPEAGLDKPAREGVRDAVLAARDDGACCLVISHDGSLWDGHVDQLLVLAPGGLWRVEGPTA
ncbi:ATP-binding cassette domain-containing protein [Falsiroseomonas sp. HC035]|uniref:ATP-binding cassette domain-containing protein n=1 Tax=Falsiroseomonas sp. HC035 TaxID=3390999 RepID=UPI003D323829